MLISTLLQTRRSDARLPDEIRASLVESLFAPIASLLVGAIACSIIGAAVAWRSGNLWIMAVSVAIFVVGMLRVASAIFYRQSRAREHASAVRLWERIYEYGAWGFGGLLGLLCWMTIALTSDAALQMAVSTSTAGYAAAISGRNAGRPFIALGQLALSTLPLSLVLLWQPDWIYKALGVVVLLFIYGMVDITLGIRNVIIQALTMTQKEAALAARFEEQAHRFDVALNNMSHGLCMLDLRDRLQVWNERFLELMNLKSSSVRVGMTLPTLLRHSIRAGNHGGKTAKTVFSEFARGLQRSRYEQVQTSPDGEKVIALSRRVMADGGSVIILEDITEHRRAQERIDYLARYDELTGLANRMQFREEIASILAARRHESHVALHLIDLDRFKTVNDTLGHPCGDKLLKEVADRLRMVIRPGDIVTRFGGDEFVVLQTHADNRQAAESLAQRIVRAITDPFEIDEHRIDIGASIGIAMASADGTDIDQLLKKADMALYAAKRGGRGSHQFFAVEMEEAMQARRALELDMREALTSNQFRLMFQPLVDLQTGRTTACEALVRWHHPRRGMILPSIFIPVAEETGMIIEIGQRILELACVEAASWPSTVKVSVNLSPVQFKNSSLVLHVASALAKSGLRAQRLDLEITERLLLEDSEETLIAMQQLKDLGVNMSLDDFGTGYSSLNYLLKFPFKKIKIDQSFIRDRETERDARSIIKAIANLGASMEKIVVAEGIETEEQMKMVKRLGCHEGQGFLFGSPMTGEEILAKLKSEAPKPHLVAPHRDITQAS
ncbi:MAG: diguanylate cyclase/phosphodiesterase (GGDEF & EAL domains) with PAS/PAC sensor(s) [Pseudolabrys sp.]|jgi:diguanylate cyclase (GGDEF)-like protein|nr:diguanylate cyclase/phosphodiesterase (GGDEF & EAL domains) with PAS/PAC sensor(s) [Pseudolabrys sp.]